MAENIQQSTEVPVGLSIFGSLVTEMSPSDLPEGVSPDNQDIIYLPGNVLSRPGMNRMFAVGTAFPNRATVTYGKTYTMPNGTSLNLYLDSFGNLWKQDVINTPTVLVKIGSVTPGCYCDSITAFGKEYFIFNNGINGIDTPRQFDGTFFDRVTQGGPGSAAALSNTSIPGVALTTAGPGGAIALSTAITSDLVKYRVVIGGEPEFIFYYTTVTFVSAAPHGFTVGETISLAGITWSGPTLPAQAVVRTVVSSTSFKISFYDDTPDNGTGGTATPPGAMLSRTSNVVTGATATAHKLQVGYQTAISGVANSNIGGGIASAVRASSVVTVTTTNAHGLVPGCTIVILGSTGAVIDGTYTVQTCPSSKTLTIINYGADAVIAAGGNVQDTWNGTFFVSAVPTATTFQYNQLGPDNTATGTGTETPYGQIAPGPHNCVVMFQTRQGLVTEPGPTATLYANGGQYLTVTNIPIGPPNTIARILAFTGSGGSRYFYIPVDVVSNGQVVSSSTVIADNTSTSAVLDFSDAALFNGIAIDISGNNLFSLKNLAPCLGVFYYASRLFFWGNYNTVNNLANLGFEGGYQLGDLTHPAGWAVGTTGGALVTAPVDSGMAWQITGDGTGLQKGAINQGCLVDSLSINILQPLTNYTWGVWARNENGVNGTLWAEIFSPSDLTIYATASIPLNQVSSSGQFYLLNFNAQIPQNANSDTVINIYTLNADNGQLTTIDEMFIYPTANPYNSNFDVSYINNPESIDAVTGQLGSTEDATPIMACFDQRDILHFLTQRGLHSTRDNGSTEPSGWTVNAISLTTGTCSVRGCTSTENFAAWVTNPRTAPPTGMGLYVYTGGDILKVSQEIQTLFNSSNQNWMHTTWVKNDPILRRIYVAIPQGAATAPSLILPLDYRELDSASDLASRPPVHISFTGKMICSDLSRKWTRWNIDANFGEMMKMPDGSTQFVLGAGNGLAPGTANGFANVYYFNSAKLTDDDYGTIVPYYVTYFFVNHETEQMLQVGLHRKLYRRWSAFLSGTGQLTITPYANTLNNPRTASSIWTLTSNPLYDLGGGLNVSAERVAFKIGTTPLIGQTDNGFSLQKFIVTLMAHPMTPVRFGAI